MPRIVREESEMDFKEPLSPSPAGLWERRLSAGSGPPHYPSHALPPVRVTATFGLMGEAGAVVSILAYFADIASDILLIIALWNQASEEPNYYKHQEEKSWFLMTLLIATVPLFVVNLLSLSWYIQNKKTMGVSGIFYKKSVFSKVVCVLMHLLLLGPVIRYLDMLKYGRKTNKHLVDVNLGSRGSVQRMTPKGEVNSALQMVLSKDTSILDIIRSFFQVCPQMVLQIFLLYRNPMISTGEINMVQLTKAAQVLKILIGLFVVAWTVTTFQDEHRRSVPGMKQLSCSATSVCLLWRASLIASRVIAIGSFASLHANGEGGLIKVSNDYHPSVKSLVSFPLITSVILAAHFIIMLVLICAQKSSFCNSYEGKPKPVLELFYSIVMSWVHVFSYINMKETPCRRRMAFFYLLMFAENTTFITIWFLQLIAKELWYRVTVLFTVEILYLIGISSIVGYYSFLQPNKNTARQLHSSWKP